MNRFFSAFLPLAVLTILAATLTLWWAMRLGGLGSRQVDSSRVEKSLAAYITFKKTGDHAKLSKELEQAKVSGAEFEKIIDRFIHYRMSKSSMDQAMKLLAAFKGGYNIYPDKVYSPSGQASFSFQLDAEVLTVFNEKPDLVTLAFGG